MSSTSSGSTSHNGIGEIHCLKEPHVPLANSCASFDTPAVTSANTDLCDTDQSYRHVTTIDILPENVLLEIFEFYRNNSFDTRLWKWHLLMHVCRRWRQIVFSSPLRLNLRILCTSRTSVENLSIWPTLPIDIEYRYIGRDIKSRGQDNVVAALKYPDRVCGVSFRITGSQLGEVTTVMTEPFPALTRLHIRSDDINVPVIPTEFLGRSAPRLREITLSGIPYPALPALLLSATHLVTLELHQIPPTGYISPQAMATCLAALSRLDTFGLQFQLSIPRPERIRPPVTRILLPVLTSFEFRGASEYLEDLVVQIDSPQLSRILVVYLNQLVDFEVAQLSKFIERSFFQMTPFKHAQVSLAGDKVSFDMCRHDFRRDESHPTSCRPPTRIVVSCQGIDWQVSHMAQVLSQLSTTLSNVVHLKLESPNHKYPQLERAEWLQLLGEFSAVQTLHASRKLASHVSLALEDITQETVAKVLPSLNLIDLQGQRASSIENFITARQLFGHPVTVINFKRERVKERARIMLERAKARDKEREREQEQEREREREREKERERARARMRERGRDLTWERARAVAMQSERELERERVRQRAILEVVQERVRQNELMTLVRPMK